MRDMIRFLQDRNNRLKLKLLGDLDGLDNHQFLVFFNKESLVILTGDNILHMCVEDHGDKKRIVFEITQNSIPVINENTNESFNITSKLVSNDLDNIELGLYKSLDFVDKIKINGVLYGRIVSLGSLKIKPDLPASIFTHLKYSYNGKNYAGGGFEISVKDGEFVCLKTYGFEGITFNN